MFLWWRYNLLVFLFLILSLEYKHASPGETITFQCLPGGNTADWHGPANNDSNPTPVHIKDEFDTTWNITAYTNNRIFKKKLVHLSRLSLDDNNGLIIKNVSSFDEGLYRCENVKNKSASSNQYILLIGKNCDTKIFAFACSYVVYCISNSNMSHVVNWIKSFYFFALTDMVLFTRSHGLICRWSLWYINCFLVICFRIQMSKFS